MVSLMMKTQGTPMITLIALTELGSQALFGIVTVTMVMAVPLLKAAGSKMKRMGGDDMAVYFYLTFRPQKKSAKSDRKSSLEKYAEENGLPYNECNVYKDRQSDSICSDRPEWLKLEKKLKKGDTVVIKSLLQLATDPKSVYQEYMRLAEKEVNLVFVNNPTVGTDYIERLQEIAESRKLMTKSNIPKTVKLIIYTELDRMMEGHRWRSEQVIKGMEKSGTKPGRKEHAELLTDALRKDINLYLSDGTVLQVDLARKHGVSTSTIKKYVKLIKEKKL